MNIAGIVPASQTAQYLRTLPSIRERCLRVFDLAKEGKLEYFEYHPEKEKDVAEFCAKLMKRDYPDFAAINPHGRWRHLDAGRPRVEPLISKMVHLLTSSRSNRDPQTLHRPVHRLRSRRCWRRKQMELQRRRKWIDIWTIGGAGCSESEGLAKLTVEKTASGFQVSEANPMVGLEGRTSLLVNLAEALRTSPDLFGKDGRPGNMVDFLQSQSKETSSKRTIPLSALWHVLVEGLNPIWPSRIQFGGISLGDVWPCDALKASSKEGAAEGDELVPFHKLTQWITYSLIEVLEKVEGWAVEGKEDLTGLPEYRNGGLLVDLGVLTLKPGKLPTDEKSGLPSVPPSHPAIIEWRAMTVIELDRIADLIRSQLSLSREQLSLAQVLEGATWKGGREIAKEKRPETSGPPIEIQSDGTVF